MSDPWTIESRAAKDRLQALPALANIPVITPDVGDINDAIDEALKQSGVKPGGTGKVGMCFALVMLAGRALDENSTEAQDSNLHLELVVNTELNASDIGQQLVPLEVFWLAVKQLISWDRGAGKQNLRFLNWDMVITKKEVTVSADFALFHVLDL
jgi:hypothetical protein